MTEQEVLLLAEAILGQKAVRVHEHRGWADFWCPFHDDRPPGRPNFGVDLREGRWKCLRCGAAGGSLRSLARALGRATPREVAPVEAAPRWRPRPNPVRRLGPVLENITRALWEAAEAATAREYLAHRGVGRGTALEYGLGYGLARPPVPQEVLEAAFEANLALPRDDGPWWLWAGGIVYPDPPHAPSCFLVRHLRPGARKKYQMWGPGRTVPLGAWRVTSTTELLVVVEGLFDMLVLADALRRRGLLGKVVPVALGGATPSAAVIRWLGDWRGDLLVLPDPDEAGRQVVERIRRARGRRPTRVVRPPGNLDPDEALLQGWWPLGAYPGRATSTTQAPRARKGP